TLPRPAAGTGTLPPPEDPEDPATNLRERHQPPALLENDNRVASSRETNPIVVLAGVIGAGPAGVISAGPTGPAATPWRVPGRAGDAESRLLGRHGRYRVCPPTRCGSRRSTATTRATTSRPGR